MNEVSPYPSRGTIYIIPDQGQEDPLSRARPVEASDAPNIRDYWHIVRKHKWRILACFAVALAGATASVLLATPIYTARAKLGKKSSLRQRQRDGHQTNRVGSHNMA